MANTNSVKTERDGATVSLTATASTTSAATASSRPTVFIARAVIEINGADLLPQHGIAQLCGSGAQHGQVRVARC